MRDAVSLSYYGIGGGGGDVPPGSIIIPPSEKGKLIVSYDKYEIFGTSNSPSEISVIYAENNVIPINAFRSIVNQNTAYCYIRKCNMPNKIKEIGDFAFYYDQNLDIELPTSLKIIGDQAFRYCAQLTLDVIPASVETIANRAFANCTKLSTITFLGTPNSIDANTFAGCNNLTIIRVPWASSAIANAPWGASNATIIYNYQGE